MPKFIIYGLIDPITNELRYVGRSSSGFYRPRNHSIPSQLKKSNNYKNNWLKKLRNKYKVKPIIYTIETLNNVEELNEAESFWISYYKSIGCRLTNLTSGGDGITGYKHTEITKNNISKNSSRHNAKKVIDQYGTIYNSAFDASRILGDNSRAVDRICRRNGSKQRSFKGFVFEYLEDVLKRNDIKAKDYRKTKEERVDSYKKIGKAHSFKVKCLKDEQIFNSLKEASEYYSLSSGSLSRYLRSNSIFIKGLKFIKI